MIKNNIRKEITLACFITLITLIHTLYPAQYGTPVTKTNPPVQNSSNSANDQPTVVYIHQTVKTLNNDADCNPAKWSTPEDACSCCLMRNKGKRGNKKTADAIIEQCTATTKQCTAQTITNIKKQYGLPTTASSQDLFDKLEDGIVIKDMEIDKSLLGPNGAFTEASLPKFLAQAYNEKKLKNIDFSKEACLKAKNLGTQGGYNTLQLFLITSTCHTGPASMYIIKEARNGIDEGTKLKEVAEFPKMKELIAPNVVPGLPTIALPLAYFSYPDTKAVHYLAAMPAAKGEALSTFTMKFRKTQSPQNKEMLSRAHKILGIETANFHKRNMKQKSGKILGMTTVHGDFHSFNLFFDPIAGHFTWIDNETMAKSLRDLASPSVDFVKLFFMPFCINQTFQQFRDLIQGIDLKTWFDVTLKNFIEGYISTYKPTEKKQLLQELKTIFNEPFTIPWVDFDDNKLAEIRTQYINPIFDALMK